VDDVAQVHAELPQRGLLVAPRIYQGTQGKRAFFIDKTATQTCRSSNREMMRDDWRLRLKTKVCHAAHNSNFLNSQFQFSMTIPLPHERPPLQIRHLRRAAAALAGGSTPAHPLRIKHTAETRTVLDASATQSALVEVFGNRSIEK